MSLYFINPPTTGADPMAARPRDAKGRFLTKRQIAARKAARKRKRTRTTTRKRNPPRKRTTRRKTTTRKRSTRKMAARKRAPARRTRRRAPTRRRTVRRRKNPDVIQRATSGVTDAAYMLAGEAVTRAVPRMVPGLPQTGATGLLIEAAVAVGVGMVADRVVGAKAADAVMAGAFAVPLRRVVVNAGIPVVSDALTPAPMGAYRVGPGSSASVRRLRASSDRMGSGSYPRALASGSYAAASGAPQIGASADRRAGL